MAAGRHVCRKVDADVVAAGQERRNDRDGAVGGQRAEHFPRSRAEDIDERDVYLPVEHPGHPGGQVTDHRDAFGFTCAVGDQKKAHRAYSSGSSTGNR
jgi:hypothetical protein